MTQRRGVGHNWENTVFIRINLLIRFIFLEEYMELCRNCKENDDKMYSYIFFIVILSYELYATQQCVLFT